MKITNGVIATIPVEDSSEILTILHFVGFGNPITERDLHNVYNELKTNPEYELTDIDFDVYEAPKATVEHFVKLMSEVNNNG